MSTSYLPSDFMDRVVAWPGPNDPGYVNLHWQAPANRSGKGKFAGFRGRPFKNLQSFMDLAQYGATNPGTFKEIYYCLSTQRQTGKVINNHPIAMRHHQQVVALKALWIDVDVKPEKGYASVNEAMDAINKFVIDANLPPYSAIVLSGGGVHVYWISDKPLTEPQWRPFAEGLRIEIQTHGLKCDAGLTTDSVRVLRVPGTYNNKLPKARPVTLKWLGASYDFFQEPRITRLATLAPTKVVSLATATVTRQATFDLSGFGKPLAGFPAPGVDNLGHGLSIRSDLPLAMDEAIKGCQHFQDCAVSHGKDHGQGLWALTLLATTFFENGRGIAHNFSRGYDKYDRGEVDNKFDEKLKAKAERNLGWPSCKAFEAEGAKCKTCPFYGRLSSPLSLAERIALPAVNIAPAPPPPADLDLPEGYTVDKEGQICEVIQKTLPSGELVDEQLPLFYCSLRNPVLQAGRRALLMETSLDGGKWGPVTIAEVDLTTEQSMIKQLRSCGVKPCVPNQRKIGHFLTSWMKKLDAAKARIQTLPFGWLFSEDKTDPVGFAYGGKVYMNDGSEQQAGYAAQQLDAFYRPRGDVQVWRDALKIVTEQNHADIEAVAACGFAAPLMIFTGKYNVIVCPYSMGSGAHKSFSTYIGLGIWGSPVATKESPGSSPKGLLHKLGEVCNLPVYWDEISDGAKMDQVISMVGPVTEGGGATLLTQARNFHPKDLWQTMLMVVANLSLTERILGKVKNTDAQLQRVFEFKVQKRADSRRESDVSLIQGALDRNYGHIGILYAEYLGKNMAAVKARVNAIVRDFEDAVLPDSAERFRTAAAATIYAGAEIANQHLGADFHLPALWDFLIVEFKRQRKFIVDAEIVSGSTENTINALTQFFKTCTRNSLWVAQLPSAVAGKPAPIVYIAGPTKEHADPVHVRLSVNSRTIDFSRQKFMDFLRNAEFNDPGAVLDGLKRHFGATEHARINLAAGSGVMAGREHIVRLPVPAGSPWVDDLFRHTPPDERPADVTVAVTGLPSLPASSGNTASPSSPTAA